LCGSDPVFRDRFSRLHIGNKARVLRFADRIHLVEYRRDTEVVARNL